MSDTISIPQDFQPTGNHLCDRVILVTGATGDLGQALCKSLAAHGATVVLAGRNVPKLERLFDEIEAQDSPEPAIYPIDLAGARPDDYADLANNLQEQLGRLDGVVHCATSFQGLTPLHQLASDKWMVTVQVGLNAVFLLNQALLGLLDRSEQPRIVFTLDDPSHSRTAYWGAYGVVQAGLRSLFEMTSDELESASVEVCAVQPPPLKSRLVGKVYMDVGPSKLAAPEQVAGDYLYLLGDHDPSAHGRVLRPRAD